jgi:hypothetical protein
MASIKPAAKAAIQSTIIYVSIEYLDDLQRERSITIYSHFALVKYYSIYLFNQI